MILEYSLFNNQIPYTNITTIIVIFKINVSCITMLHIHEYTHIIKVNHHCLTRYLHHSQIQCHSKNQDIVNFCNLGGISTL